MSLDELAVNALLGRDDVGTLTELLEEGGPASLARRLAGRGLESPCEAARKLWELGESVARGELDLRSCVTAELLGLGFSAAQAARFLGGRS